MSLGFRGFINECRWQECTVDGDPFSRSLLRDRQGDTRNAKDPNHHAEDHATITTTVHAWNLAIPRNRIMIRKMTRTTLHQDNY